MTLFLLLAIAVNVMMLVRVFRNRNTAGIQDTDKWSDGPLQQSSSQRSGGESEFLRSVTNRQEQNARATATSFFWAVGTAVFVFLYLFYLSI